MSGLESTNTINLFRVAPLMFVSLSKTTKLILLDSLLQEVCVKTDLTCHSPLSSLRVSVSLFSHKPSLFRTKESPLNLRKLKDIKTAVSTYLYSMMMLGAFF